MQAKNGANEQDNMQHSLEKIVESLIGKYAPGIEVEEGVSSRLMDFTLKVMMNILAEGGKMSEFTGDNCVSADHIRIALRNISDRDNELNPDHLMMYAKQRNQNKPVLNIEESILYSNH